MTTNEKNSENDRNNDDLNRQNNLKNDNLKGEAGKAVTSNFENAEWGKKSKEDDDHNAPRTTNPSATQGFEANRDRNKYDDGDQDAQNRDKSGSNDTNNAL